MSKNEKSCPGYKAAKYRLTLILGGSAERDFDFKLFDIPIRKSKGNEEYKQERSPGAQARYQKGFIITATLFKDYDVPEFKSYCFSQQIQLKLLLSVDNAPRHPFFPMIYLSM